MGRATSFQEYPEVARDFFLSAPHTMSSKQQKDLKPEAYDRHYGQSMHIICSYICRVHERSLALEPELSKGSSTSPISVLDVIKNGILDAAVVDAEAAVARALDQS